MSRYCSKCGSELKDDSNFCSKCGEKIDNGSTKIQSVEKVVSKGKEKKPHGCLTLFLIVIVVPMILVSIGVKVTSESDKVPKEVDFIMESGIEDKEKAIKINEILKECDIEADSMTRDEMLDNMTGSNEVGYRVSVQSINNIILYLKQDGTVYNIRYADEDLYSDNKVVSKLTDYFLTTDEETNFQIKVKNAVKGVLKSPSTAKFPGITQWKFSKNKDTVVIQSYVDSQNSFGAMLRSEFQVKIDTKEQKVISFIFDGKEYIQ